jgi:hypothetical protein
MSNVKKILKRAIKHGFDLASVPNYTAHSFKTGLFEFLVEENFCVFEEDGELYVGYDPFLDIAKVSIEGFTMKVLPLSDEGFFEILIQLFKYITVACKIEEKPKIDDDDEITTEDFSEEPSSEELWL